MFSENACIPVNLITLISHKVKKVLVAPSLTNDTYLPVNGLDLLHSTEEYNPGLLVVNKRVSAAEAHRVLSLKSPLSSLTYTSKFSSWLAVEEITLLVHTDSMSLFLDLCVFCFFRPLRAYSQ